MTVRKSKLPKVKVMLPNKIASGARSKVNPNDFNAVGVQFREVALMPFLNESINDLRAVWEMTKLIRHLSRIEGPISTAIFNLVQVADSPFTISAFDTNTNHFDPDGVDLCKSILNKMECAYDVNGFSNVMGFSQLRQTMLRESVITNGVATELVLDKAHLPSFFQIVGLETLRWTKNAENKYVPNQMIAGDPKLVPLDIPNFFVSRAVGDPADILPRSIMEAAIKLLIYFEEILEDIRKSMKQTGYARNVVTLDLQKIKDAAPRSVVNDTKLFQEFCEQVRHGVEQTINNIDPEDALVMFDVATFKVESPNFGKDIDYSPLMNAVSGMYATSMKTPPTVLGMRMDSGSQALGNVETLIFLKAARSVQQPVETQLSRALTLACRLYGANVYIEFKFDPINIRPDTETEAFKTMRQTRILEQLSIGFITDEVAALKLKTGKRPPGAPKLSGTFFHILAGALPSEGTSGNTDDNGQPVPAANKKTPGGNSQQPKPGDTPIGKTLQPNKTAPRKAGGRSQ